MRGFLIIALFVASSDGYGGRLPSSASSSFFRGGDLQTYSSRFGVPPVVGLPCCDFDKLIPPLGPFAEPMTMRKQKASDKRTRRAQRFGSEAAPSSAGGRGRGSSSPGAGEGQDDDGEGEPAAAAVLERASEAFKFKTKKPTQGGPGGAASAGSSAGNTRSRSAKKQVRWDGK